MIRGASRALIALALALTLAGCFSGPDASSGSAPPASMSSASACVSEEARAASGNAPLLAPHRGEPVDVAARFADAVEDPLTSREPDPQMSSADAPKYRTESTGTVTVDLGGHPDDMPRLHWFGGSDAHPYALDEPHGAFLNASLARFGIDPQGVAFVNVGGGDRPLVRFWQEYEGDHVQGTGGSFRPGLPLLTLEPAFDLGNASATVSEDASIATAQARMRCELDGSGHAEGAGYAFERVTHVAWAVAHESLVRTVFLEFTEPQESHCGLVYAVDVDAATGAVLGWGRPPCD